MEFDVISRLNRLANRAMPQLTAHEQTELLLDVKELAKNEGEREPILFLLRCFRLQEEASARTYLQLQRRIVFQAQEALWLLEVGDRVPKAVEREMPVDSAQLAYSFERTSIAPIGIDGSGLFAGLDRKRRLFRRDIEGWSRVE